MIRMKDILTEQEKKHYIVKWEDYLSDYYENVQKLDVDSIKLYWRDCAGVTFEMSANDKQKLEKVNDNTLRFASLPEDEGTVSSTSTGEPEKLTLRKCVLGILDKKMWDFYITKGKKPSKANAAIILE